MEVPNLNPTFTPASPAVRRTHPATLFFSISKLGLLALCIALPTTIGALSSSLLAQEAPTKTAPSTEDDSASAKEKIGLKVELIDAGATPRTAMRLTPEVGSIQTCEMRMTMGMTMKMGAQAMPTNTIPEQSFTIEITIKDVLDNGDIQYDLAYTDARAIAAAGVQAEVVEVMNQALRPLKGMTGRGLVTETGIAKSAELNIPDDAPADFKNLMSGMTEALERLSMAIPEEPIGVGAKWKTTQDLKTNGILLTQSTTYHLVGIEGNVLVLETSVDQQAEPQDFVPANVPADSVKAHLDELQSSGDGKVRLDLQALMPSESTADITSKVSMEITAAGQSQKIETNTTIGITLKDATP
jgi:hypothetical protein